MLPCSASPTSERSESVLQHFFFEMYTQFLRKPIFLLGKINNFHIKVWVLNIAATTIDDNIACGNDDDDEERSNKINNIN